MHDTLFDAVYSINKGIYGSGKEPTRSERAAAVECKKDCLGYFVSHNWIGRRVFDGKCTFVSAYNFAKMDSVSRILLPAMKDLDIEEIRNELAQAVPNTEHLSRRGILYPDNTLTGAVYGTALGAIASFAALGSVGSPYTELGAEIGGIAGTWAAAEMRNRSFFNFQSRQDIRAPRPWDSLQVLDFEMAYYKKGDLELWAYMDLNPLDITKNMSKAEINNLKRNKLLLNEGITSFYGGAELSEGILA